MPVAFNHGRQFPGMGFSVMRAVTMGDAGGRWGDINRAGSTHEGRLFASLASLILHLACLVDDI